nr:DUF3048 C-terminal domain-containing protein [Lachnospiraceae bacterium]
IVQEAKLDQLDEHGYMHFYVTENAGMHGWYCTGGKAIPVTWEKKGDTVATRYYNADGEEITVNIGKTYIAIVRSTDWDKLDIH